MRTLAAFVPIATGGIVLLYVFTAARIWNNHSVQSYLLLCTGILSINLGMLAIALGRHNN